MSTAKISSDVFAARLRDILAERGLTQAQAAELLGVSQALVNGYLRGKYSPLRRTAAHIAQRLGVSIQDLTGAKAGQTSVREGAAPYRLRNPGLAFAADLKRRWQRHPKQRAQLELAIRTAWPETFDQVLSWLNQP